MAGGVAHPAGHGVSELCLQSVVSVVHKHFLSFGRETDRAQGVRVRVSPSG